MDLLKSLVLATLVVMGTSTSNATKAPQDYAAKGDSAVYCTESQETLERAQVDINIVMKSTRVRIPWVDSAGIKFDIEYKKPFSFSDLQIITAYERVAICVLVNKN